MTIPITTLELRTIEIPSSRLLEFLERKTGQPFTHNYRHYLAGEPVHCGDALQRFDHGKGNWITGRYEWTFRPEDPPTFHCGEQSEQVIELTENCLLRWPK